jgi:hypothetical protein
MNHLSEEQLVDAYYGEKEGAIGSHLEGCLHCASAFRRLKETLDLIIDYPVPERPSYYGASVWAGVQTRLPVTKRVRWWFWAPVFATALAIAFLAGTLVTKTRQPATVDVAAMQHARDRVLLLAIGDHLERSQIVLTELMHADVQTADLTAQRKIAADLVEENRLLRERAAQTGDVADAALLEDVQRVLLDVANGADDLKTVQRSIEDQNLLFKVRIVSQDADRKGQTL